MNRFPAIAAVLAAAAVAGAGAPVLAVGGATATPVLVDVPADVEQVADAAYQACEDAFGDLSAPAQYRRAMTRVYARRAVEAALAARP